jgi:uncharacterized protein YbjQ (UPF0145 family)
MSWTCKNCKEEIEEQFDSCWSCGASREGVSKTVFEPEHVNFTEVEPEFSEAVRSILITTAPTLAGYRICKTIDIVSAECVFGMNLFRDLFVFVRDILGGRSKAAQKIFRDARKTCLLELRREAEALGANAVIAVDLDYNEISGSGKSMLFLAASGTAVIVEPLEL